MKKLFFLFPAICLYALPIAAQPVVPRLRTENEPNPIGIDQTSPRFSWQLTGSKRNLLQTAYEIKVSSGKSTAWNSGKVTSGQSVQVLYAGEALQSGKIYHWQ